MRTVTLSIGFGGVPWALSLALSLALASMTVGCGNGDGDDGGMGGSGGGGEPTDERYVIEDVSEDCDGVEGLRAAAILDALGLEFEGEFSWTDLETGYESSRSIARVEATIEDDGVITCIPFRHYPGQAPEYAHLSYDAATLSVVTEDGLLSEVGSATVWLFETPDAGVFDLEVVRAFPVSDVEGTFEPSSTLGDDYETFVLVFAPSETMPLGHVSVARESTSEVLSDGDTAVGIPHGYFPAVPE